MESRLNKLEILILNTKQKYKVTHYISVGDLLELSGVHLHYPVLGALVNNTPRELSFTIYKPCQVTFFDITHPEGHRMYVRSLIFVLLKAARNLSPNRRLMVEHAVSKGLYCEYSDSVPVTIEEVFELGAEMRNIIARDVEFVKEAMLVPDAIEVFEKNNYLEKAKLFRTRKKMYTAIYHLEDFVEYFYGNLVKSTGQLTIFDLVKYQDGMLLMLPPQQPPIKIEDFILQPKLFDIFQEYKHWGEILGITTIGSINEYVQANKTNELIHLAEALHEKKVASIAEQVVGHLAKPRLILISGPSSSGKTSFAKRLAVQLRVLGIKTVQISLDNYFVNREDTPKDAHGEYNFEALEAIDLDLFNKQLIQLMDGEEIEIPKFSFESGSRYWDGTKLQIEHSTFIIVEGIHGLNPGLTNQINNVLKFKIYVSALTNVGIDFHNRIPTTDNRLIRRIIRDYQYRGYSAKETLKRWPSVRKGEDAYIFPYQEEADVMFNSSLFFELGVLKPYVEIPLHEVYESDAEYAEAKRLLKFLSYFLPIPDTNLPPTSILREFLKGSSFHYD